MRKHRYSMHFREFVENLKQLTVHLETLIARNQSKVARDIHRMALPWFDANNQVAHIHITIRSPMDYWQSLHELGHLELGHNTPTNWDEEARMEIQAWDYVKENSVIAIPASVAQGWENERIRGSWERS